MRFFTELCSGTTNFVVFEWNRCFLADSNNYFGTYKTREEFKNLMIKHYG